MSYDPKVTGKRPIRLADYPTGSMAGFKNKQQALLTLERRAKEIGELQEVLYPQASYGILVVLHGADTAGKSTLIKRLVSGVNAAGASVASFKAPTGEELSHDYLWRHMAHLPARGKIAFFDRSYYEEVSAVKVHPEFLEKQRIPAQMRPKNIWKARYKEIRNFEQYLHDNGIVVIKLYLHLSKEEQKNRLLRRLKRSDKNHKYSSRDLEERRYFERHERAVEGFINNTATTDAPWYVLPADKKWVTRALAAEVIAKTMRALDLRMPVMDAKVRRRELKALHAELIKENGVKKK